MKFSIFLSSLWLFAATFFAQKEQSNLSGQVTDGKDPLIGAMVRLLKGAELVQGATTDVDGKYHIKAAPGTYALEFSYTGFQTRRIVDVVIEEGKQQVVDAVLLQSAVLDEVVVTGYNKATRSDDGAYGATGVGGEPRRKSVARGESDKKMAKSAPAGVKPVIYTGPEAPRALSAPPPPVYEESIKERKPVVTYKSVDDDKRPYEAELEDSEISVPSGSRPDPRAGLLTAGEWNDLHNWNRHWADLLADGETDAWQKMYGFYPRKRYTVLLTNENDVPVADAVAQLKTTDGKILWSARTDNTGKAELWADMFNATASTTPVRIEVWVNGAKSEVRKPVEAASGVNAVKVSAPCNAPKNVDIVWAVDATGSMGDEIEYLKTELLDVIGRAKNRNPELAFRMGTVFYRDNGDEYITKSSGLSPDINQTVEFIRKQFAAGGGDYPEAVHSALEEAIFKQKWSEYAITRICFLVLDASPHQGAEINASLQKSIQEAARLGIRIVPVTASGIQKDTEFLMKFFGLATNGSYVFLTDHSGIGGKHLEPTTDEYKVEPLNDLLVRLIGEYTSIETCEGKSEIRFENDPQQQPGAIMHALYYPNPAMDQFTLELPFEVQSVTIYNAEGVAVHKLEKPLAGANQILVSNLPAGMYTIRILNNGLMQSGKLMVVRA